MDPSTTNPAPADAAPKAVATTGDAKKKFVIKKWHAVTLWTWDICVENCAICRNHIMDLCIEAQANPEGHNASCDTPCNVAWGVCSHAFHFCCICRWLKTRTVCPLCSKEWEYARVGKNSA